MLIVADTSPINYLILIQQEMLLAALYHRVVAPPAVHAELQRPRTPAPVREWVARPPAWFAIQPPQHPLSMQQFPKLHDGELEAIPLAQEICAAFLLIDEQEGRKEAKRRDVPVIGTLGVLEHAAIRGLVDLHAALTCLEATTFHGSPRLFAELRARDADRKRRQH